MPPLSVFFIRAALAYLSAGTAVGSVLLWQKGSGGITALWMLREAHIIFLTLGFLIHFVVGTGWWIFPRIEKRRGHETVMIAGAILLNLGIALECAASLGFSGGLFPGNAALMEIAGIACFLSQLAPRVAQQFLKRG